MITVRARDTEPLEFDIGAIKDGAPLVNLDDMVEAHLFGMLGNALYINGVEVTRVTDTDLTLRFNPTGAGPTVEGSPTNAFDIDGILTGNPRKLHCWVRVAWSDGQYTRHPAEDDGSLDILVTANHEPTG